MPAPTPGSASEEESVPLVIVKMLAGRTMEQKRRLVEEITEVVTRVTGAPAEKVDVIIEDHPRENWASGGRLYSDS
jgi:4-oxalocrotonate tautomerase